MASAAQPTGGLDSERALAQRLRAALNICAADASLQQGGHWLQTRCLIEIGTERLLLEIAGGKLTLIQTQAPLTAWDFAIRGTARAWSEFWRNPPPPGWHDLFALAKRGELRLEGNLQPFMTHLQYFKDLLASPRGSAAA